MNPYQAFASSFARLFAEGRSLPLGEIPVPARITLPAEAPTALIFSPHPDDECVIGGLALRLMRESGMRVVNIAVTLGSNPHRRDERWKELTEACHWIGFELESPMPGGLERINPETRAEDPGHWQAAVSSLAAVLHRHQPQVILFPHPQDWNTTHVGTHQLMMDALQTMPDAFACFLVETEFWGQMSSPNLMVELSVEQVADMMAALSFHIGEVRRNPYHLRMPAWLQDNVRRGAELVGGQGAEAPEFLYATLYRLRRWSGAKVHDVLKKGQTLGLQDSPDSLLKNCLKRHT